jgi:hypothetical protein
VRSRGMGSKSVAHEVLCFIVFIIVLITLSCSGSSWHIGLFPSYNARNVTGSEGTVEACVNNKSRDGATATWTARLACIMICNSSCDVLSMSLRRFFDSSLWNNGQLRSISCRIVRCSLLSKNSCCLNIFFLRSTFSNKSTINQLIKITQQN